MDKVCEGTQLRTEISNEIKFLSLLSLLLITACSLIIHPTFKVMWMKAKLSNHACDNGNEMCQRGNCMDRHPPTHTHIYASTHAHAHTHECTHVHTHTYAYEHTHTHTNTEGTKRATCGYICIHVWGLRRSCCTYCHQTHLYFVAVSEHWITSITHSMQSADVLSWADFCGDPMLP